MRKAGPYPVTGTVTHYMVGDGADLQVIGKLYSICGTDGRAFWVAESHDWDADPAEQEKGFVPLHLGVFQDPTEAEGLIERRAREAQAPDTLPEKQPVTHLFADQIDAVTGEPMARVEHGEGGTIVATLDAGTPEQARALTAKLKAGIRYASVKQDGATVKLWSQESFIRNSGNLVSPAAWWRRAEIEAAE